MSNVIRRPEPVPELVNHSDRIRALELRKSGGGGGPAGATIYRQSLSATVDGSSSSYWTPDSIHATRSSGPAIFSMDGALIDIDASTRFFHAQWVLEFGWASDPGSIPAEIHLGDLNLLTASGGWLQRGKDTGGGGIGPGIPSSDTTNIQAPCAVRLLETSPAVISLTMIATLPASVEGRFYFFGSMATPVWAP